MTSRRTPEGSPRSPKDAGKPLPTVSDDELAGTVALDATGNVRPGMSDETAELAVLAGVLTLPECLYDVVDVIDADDFASELHATVWRAVLACEQQGRPVDVITVADELKRAGALGRVGGRAVLDRIVTDGAPFVDNIVAHAAIIADCALARRVLSAGRAISAEATDVRHSGSAVLESAERRVFELGAQRQSGSLISMADGVPQMLQELAKVRSDALLGHTTGFDELDAMTGGAQAGQLIIVAARPAMGKSAMALGLARAIAQSGGGAVAFLSYEMSSQELLVRMMSAMSGIELHSLRQGRVPPDLEPEVARQAKAMMELPLYIDDNPPETVSGVRAAMRRLARREKLAAVVVDYLQLMSGERRNGVDDNRVQEVSVISRGLKKLARELEVPVFALSQLNRSLEQRPSKIPQLSDLRDSGSLEQDADTVWFLYRDWVYHPESDPSQAELIIAKQRNGPTGKIGLTFDAGCANFRSNPGGSSGRGHATGGAPSSRVPRPRRDSGAFF
jgi:replicative DNA helicase